MKSALAAFGDTGAAPGSPTKASFQKRKEMRGAMEVFSFVVFLSFFLSFASSSMQPGIEEMPDSQSG